MPHTTVLAFCQAEVDPLTISWTHSSVLKENAENSFGSLLKTSRSWDVVKSVKYMMLFQAHYSEIRLVMRCCKSGSISPTCLRDIICKDVAYKCLITIPIQSDIIYRIIAVSPFFLIPTRYFHIQERLAVQTSSLPIFSEAVSPRP